MSDNPGESGAGVAATDEDLQARVERLEEHVERLNEALASQSFIVVDGYVVHVYEGPEDGGFVAACPTLHCVAGGDTQEEAVEVARGQVGEMLEFLEEEGVPIPPKDIEGWA
ncbi:MAG: type II toxin-antitoxin system HicB family antitoxin [Armatimonadota bacterium]